jgi:hypothetical protein
VGWIRLDSLTQSRRAKVRRVIWSIVILPNSRRPKNAGHRMNNPAAVMLVSPVGRILISSRAPRSGVVKVRSHGSYRGGVAITPDGTESGTSPLVASAA